MSEANGKLFATVVFEKTNYRGALADYMESRDWAMRNGILFHEEIAGIIPAPTYKGQKAPDSIVPPDWDLEDPEWQVTMELFCLKTDTTPWLEKLKLEPPANANFVVPR